jgi:glycosyltransferase involved in cell wall biosynthesis
MTSIIVLNNFLNDSRVIKEATTLSTKFKNVHVFAIHEDGLKEKEINDHFSVTRIKLVTKNWSKFKLVQILKYLEFCFKAYRLTRKSENVMVVDLSALPIGYFLKLFNSKIHVVYDSHEYAVNCKPNESKLSMKFNYFYERLFIRKVDKVINVSYSIADKYSELYGIKKPEVILNCPHYKSIESSTILRDKFQIDESKTIFITQGLLMKGRGIEIILDAFKQITDKKNVIIFMGYGPLKDLIIKAADENDNIFYQEAVPHKEIISYTSSADFGISLIENSCLSYYYCLPNKFFEFIMSEIPLLVSNLPDMASIVTKQEIGLVVEEENANALMDTIMKAGMLDKNKLKDNLKNIKKEFCWENQEEKFLNLFSK